MKNNLNVLAALTLTLLVASCAKDELTVPSQASGNDTQESFLDENAMLKMLGEQDDIGLRSARPLHVYTLSNEASGNKVIAFDIGLDGTLSELGSYSTGGTGTSGGLGNQGALALAKNARFLYAVNPGSNDFSVFYIRTDGSLVLKDKISSGGQRPVSITERNGLIYVLNAGGNGGIAGFGYNNQVQLVPIPNSQRPLSSNAAGAAQISFSPDGNALVVSEKATNTITSYRVFFNRPYTMNTFPAAGVTPFGFAFGHDNNFFVSEATGGAAGASTVSSYHVDSYGKVTLVDGPVATNRTAACWLVVTNNGRNLFTTNTGSNDISTVSLSGFGKLTSVSSSTAPAMTKPIDAALDKNSDFLYVLASGSHTIYSYSVGNSGNLTQIDSDGNLPDFSTGLVVQ